MKKILFILICFIILGQSATSFSEEGRIYLPNAYKEDWVIDQETNWINPNLYFATISNISSKELRLIAGIRQSNNELLIVAETKSFYISEDTPVIASPEEQWLVDDSSTGYVWLTIEKESDYYFCVCFETISALKWQMNAMWYENYQIQNDTRDGNLYYYMQYNTGTNGKAETSPLVNPVVCWELDESKMLLDEFDFLELHKTNLEALSYLTAFRKNDCATLKKLNDKYTILFNKY